MNDIRLSILVCSLPNRKDFLKRLHDNLHSQIHFDHHEYRGYGYRAWSEGEAIDLFVDDRPNPTIGEKRNHLLKLAVDHQKTPGYVAFIDDDDDIESNYIYHLTCGMLNNVDCCSLRGIITDDGQNPRMFEHSIKYHEYKTVEENGVVRYERYPNHLNCIKTGIAAQFTFPEKNFGEDTTFANKLHDSRFIKTEHWIEPIIYFYKYRSKK